MKDPKNYRQAHDVIAWGGCMRPVPAYRIHAQHYKPAPTRRINLFRRVVRFIVGAMS